MDVKNHSLVVSVAATIVLGAGCGKSVSASATPSVPPEETIARVHWVGKQRLSADTNSAGLMAIWKLPESVQLEAQTLDKLAAAPWLLYGLRTDTNASALLLPLLDDVLNDESYLEVRRATNQPGELALAIHLSGQRADVWETNLAAVLESLTRIRPVPAEGGRQGWSLKKHKVPNLIQLRRAGEWTILGAAEDQNPLVDEMVARIGRGEVPFPMPATNNWLEADFDLRQFASAFSLSWHLPQCWPKISLAVSGDGHNVHTRGELKFPQALPYGAEAWQIPTNLIHAPVTAFTAVRGFGPLLGSLPVWTNLQLGLGPNEFFSWAERGSLMQTFFAAPMPGASNWVNRVGGLILQKCGPWFAAHSLAGFARSPDLNGIQWTGLPFLTPFLRSITTNGEHLVVGGLFPLPPLESPAPEVPKEVLEKTNLVCYDWEMTGPRIDAWLFISQFTRVVTHQAQLPFESASLKWLKALAPKLGKSVTEISRTGPDEISFTRRSSIGFTGIELHLLADWLESPRFPLGLHTLLAPPDKVPAVQSPPAASSVH